jgi:hypothetical protein
MIWSTSRLESLVNLGVLLTSSTLHLAESNKRPAECSSVVSCADAFCQLSRDDCDEGTVVTTALVKLLDRSYDKTPKQNSASVSAIHAIGTSNVRPYSEIRRPGSS